MGLAQKRHSFLELDHVVTDRTEVGKVVHISSKLLDDRIA